MEMNVKKTSFLFPHFLFLWFSVMILLYTLILLVSKYQLQQQMTSELDHI